MTLELIYDNLYQMLSDFNLTEIEIRLEPVDSPESYVGISISAKMPVPKEDA